MTTTETTTTAYDAACSDAHGAAHVLAAKLADLEELAAAREEVEAIADLGATLRVLIAALESL